jgi:prenyltransferase beta subunit
MTIRLDMLRAASLAKHLLGDSAELVASFITKQLNPDGGFKGRSGQSDLYYTVFGIESLLALGAEIQKKHVLNYLLKFHDGSSLDLVHLACLARCRADLSQTQDARLKTQDARLGSGIVRNIERCRCSDGAYNISAGFPHGSAYGCFLAFGAYQDLNIEMQNTAAIVDCVKSLQTPDGAYSNDRIIQIGSTTATAAALAVLHYLNQPIDSRSTNWLLSRLQPQGGFVATAIPGWECTADLLSTATALHALSLAGVPIDSIKKQCLNFLNTLWSDEGSFRSSSTDDTLDCEYTYYGLLALGHLSK